MLYLGCPQWSGTNWKGKYFTRHVKPKDMLFEYGQVFNSVEGNTTFYADPSPDTISHWLASVGPEFRFTFKIPKRFSHESSLNPSERDLTEWLNLMAPLLPNLGQLMLQLPAKVGPNELAQLQRFVAMLPKEFPLGIEVRHRKFFEKSDDERAFNRFLIDNQINRVIMDTRPLFSEAPSSDAIIDAQRKKPRVPVNVIATHNAPIIRFVGCSELIDNRPFYAPWLVKIRQWLEEGKTPYVFFHTADNIDSPLLARQFVEDLGYPHCVTAPFPAEKEMKQTSLF